jgi:hypothetical protein
MLTFKSNLLMKKLIIITISNKYSIKFIKFSWLIMKYYRDLSFFFLFTKWKLPIFLSKKFIFRYDLKQSYK